MAMPPTPLLETERLLLRPRSLDDLEATYRRFRRWEVVEFLPNVPWPLPEDDTEKAIQNQIAEMERGEKSHWGIWVRAGPHEPVGAIGLWPDDGESRDMRGFWLDPDFRGQGLMTEAADAVTDYALITLGWPYLWLSNLLANQASARVKQRQGASLVDEEDKAYVRGVLRRQVWRISREDWMAGRASA